MTQSTDTGDRRRVLRVYRLYRPWHTPFEAMRATQDHFAYLTAQSVRCLALDAAVADAQCFSVADEYRSDIIARGYRSPYWRTGKYTPPIPPEVIDRCLSCGTRWENHNDGLTLHAFRSSL